MSDNTCSVVAVINILIDIWITILPIKTLSNIKWSTRDKIVLFVIFGVGGFSCISSIIRLYTIRVFVESDDPFFDRVPINVWSMIEIRSPMIPSVAKAVQNRRINNISNPTVFDSNVQQIFSLREEGTKSPSVGLQVSKTGYIVRATLKEMGGSEEHMIPQFTEIEYERGRHTEETNVGSAQNSLSGSPI
ncbi:hypothetical protein WAI453_007872 [Rhynchosporium graminicola]